MLTPRLAFLVPDAGAAIMGFPAKNYGSARGWMILIRGARAQFVHRRDNCYGCGAVSSWRYELR